MAGDVKLLFTPKPGKYPDHKGGRTWLHDPGGIRQVPHKAAPSGFTLKPVAPKVLKGGDTATFTAERAATMLKRYECWSRADNKTTSEPSSTPSLAPKAKDSKGDDA